MNRRPRAAAVPCRCVGGLAAGFVLFCFGTVFAQTLRDPTVPPAAPAAWTSGSETGRLGIGAEAIIVREGRPQLVIGSRVYAQGQKIGGARIERISETEIWLREDGVVRKLPRFPGVERGTGSVAESASKLPAASASNPEVHSYEQKRLRRD